MKKISQSLGAVWLFWEKSTSRFWHVGVIYSWLLGYANVCHTIIMFGDFFADLYKILCKLQKNIHETNPNLQFPPYLHTYDYFNLLIGLLIHAIFEKDQDFFQMTMATFLLNKQLHWIIALATTIEFLLWFIYL